MLRLSRFDQLLRERLSRVGYRPRGGRNRRDAGEECSQKGDSYDDQRTLNSLSVFHRFPLKVFYPSSLACSLSLAMTVGSASVVVSPRTRPSAISRNRRRMILALRVLGSSAVKKISSGRAMAPILVTTCCFNSSLSASLAAMLSFNVTKAEMPCPFTSWVLPMTAASATAG